jgi:serine/threonine protein phosphatase PrpC
VTVLRSGSATDVGRVRKVNQDLPLETSNLFAVADGMGGHVGGEVAARVAVDTLLQVFSREPTKAGLEAAFSKANQAVWQESQDHSELRGMGTTLTAAALVGGDDGHDRLALANVGDSRAYLFSGGRIVQVTADHSLAEERMRQGEMTEEEAAVHPQRHILTRALGISSDVDTDMWELELRAGDRLLLCSDGLSNELSNEQLADVLSTVPDPSDAAHQLVEVANEHGGSDNITVVVVDVLVGEETAAVSVITPVGERAGAPLVVAPPPGAGGGATGLLGSAVAGGSTTFAGAGAGPAAAAGQTTQLPAVRRDGPRTGEFFPDSTQAVPVARATIRSAVLPPPIAEAAPPNESRGARRRRMGIPRRITFRVVFFVLLVAAIPTGAFYAIRWYAYDNWYLSIHKDHVVIEQGRPAGVLWFHARTVDRTGVTTSQILPTGVADIRAGVQEPSLHAAKHYVANLQNEYATKNTPALGAGLGGSTTTTAPVSRTRTGPATSGSGPTTTTAAPGVTATTAATAAPTTTISAVTPAVGSTATSTPTSTPSGTITTLSTPTPPT